jgi:hypothetical protein
MSDPERDPSVEGDPEIEPTAQPTIAWYYDEAANPDKRFHPGVPLIDLTQSRFAEIPQWLRPSIVASPFYSKNSPPRPTQLPVFPEATPLPVAEDIQERKE